METKDCLFDLFIGKYHNKENFAFAFSAVLGSRLPYAVDICAILAGI